MNDLEQLAAAVREGRRSAPARIPPAMERTRRRRTPMIWVIVVGLITVTICVAVFLLNTHGEIGGNLRPSADPTIDHNTHTYSFFEPPDRPAGFEVSCRTTHGGFASFASTAWRITNTEHTPLIIKRFVYNSEHDAVPAEPRGGGPYGVQYFSPALEALDGLIATKLPITLTIGDSTYFFQNAEINVGGEEKDYYRKSAIYIDIYTNRGHFVYRPDGGLNWISED